MAGFREPLHKRTDFIRQTRMVDADPMIEHLYQLETLADFGLEKVLNKSNVIGDDIKLLDAFSRMACHGPDSVNVVGDGNTGAPGRHDGGHGSGSCFTARLVAQKKGPDHHHESH